MDVDRDELAERLRAAGATFALVFGSRARGDARPDSDLDVAGWWPTDPPHAWDVDVPDDLATPPEWGPTSWMVQRH